MIRSFVAAALCLATVSFADAVNVSVESRALMGKGWPSVSIQILEPIAGFKLNLKRSDGKDVEIKGGGKVGVTRVLDLNQPEGKFGYTGALTVNFPNGNTSEMPLQFDAELWGPLHMKCEKTDFDLVARKTNFTTSRPIDRAVVQVLMDTGKYAFKGEVPFNGKPGPYEITWPEAPGRVMKVVITVHDSASFFTGVEFHPWQNTVKHQDVNFASGKTDIGPQEAEKLEESYVKIGDELTKFGRFAEIKLYVIGHTDTMGKSDANRTLSLNRARAISAYLRKRGLTIPIFYEGFGEESLLAATGDEVDEPRNRRAEYILSIDPPTGTFPFSPRWQRL